MPFAGSGAGSAGPRQALRHRRWRLRTEAMLAGSSVAVLAALIVAPAQAQTVWTGSVSSDWFNAGNWSAGLPSGAQSALLNTITPNATVIAAPGAASLDLLVGDTGIGQLAITGGGTLANGVAYVGYLAGSQGTVTVGSGSSWSNSSILAIGENGSGQLIIANGGAVSNADGYIGTIAGSQGTVTVTGPGSTWSNSASLFVGGRGTGQLTIASGGAVSGAGGYVGFAAGSLGTVTVTGSGSTWTNSFSLEIGRSGAGQLTIENGGAVSNGTGVLGAFAGSQGTVTVTGSGSTWTNSSYLQIGRSEIGLLSIENGGAVSSSDGYIGTIAGSQGTVTVTGPGSTWSNSAFLFVGDGGTGQLTIANGGQVNAATGVQIGVSAGSTGTLNIGAPSGQAATAPGMLNTPTVAFGAGSGTLTFNHTGTAYEFAAAISGNGAVEQIGSGTTVLTGNNTYTGGTTITAGTLALSGTGRLAASGAVTIGSGAAFRIDASSVDQTIGSLSGSGSVVLGANTLTFGDPTNQTFAGSIGGAGGIVKQGSGKQTLTGINTYLGGTTITAGTLALSGAGTLAAGGSLNLAGAGAEFDISAASHRSIGALSGVVGSTITLGANTLTFGDATNQTFAGSIGGTGGITKQGTGRQTLTGASTYTGGTTINDGTLALSGAGSLAASGSLSLSGTGAGFDISGASGNRTIGALSGGAGSTITLGTHTLTFGDATSQVFGGVISGTGGVVKQGTGTLTLAGANTFTGDVTINAGTLALGAGGSLALGSAVSLAGAGTAFDISASGTDQTIGGLSGAAGSVITLGANTLTFGDATNRSFAGSIGGSGGSVKQGAGMQVLSGPSSYSGSTTVSAGELRVDGALTGSGAVTVGAGATLSGTGSIAGAVTVDGTLSAGHSPGTLSVGTLTLNGGSTSLFELNTPGIVGGSDPVTGNDLVQVAGNLTLGGTLDARAAAAGYYRLFNYGGALLGSFASQSVTSTRSGFTIAGAQVETAVPGQVNLAMLGTGQTMQFWDGVNTSGNGTVDGGAGTWAGFGTNWTSSTGSTNGGWSNSVGVFAGAAGGAVSVAGSVAFDTLQFSTNGYALSGGTLSISPASGSAGTFNIDSGVVTSIASTIADGGGTAITKLGSGTLVLGGTNTYTGGTTINAGTLSISANANLGDLAGGLTFDGGTLATTASFAMFRPVTLAGAGGVDVAASTQFELGGAMAGSGSLTKLGAGTLILSGFNTHSGGTVVTAGILEAGSADALGSGPLTLDRGTFRAGTTFTNNFANAIRVNAAGGMIDVNGQAITLSGNISDGSGPGGALAFVNSDPFIGAAELAGVNTHSGRTSVGDGVTLIALSDTAFSPNSDVVLAATGALLADGRNVTVRSLSGTGAVGNGDSAAGSLTIALPSGWASYAGVIMDGAPGDAPLALVKAGAGTQILTGTNSYSGGTTITGGVLQVGDGGTSGSITGDVVNNRTLSFNRSDDIVFAGAISGTGDVQKHHGAGTLRLTGVNSYSGGTLIVGGTLIGSATSFGSGGIANLGTLVIDQPSDASFANALSGTGSFIKRGAGSLNLTGTSTLSGATTVEAGRLSVNGALPNSAVTVLSGAALGGSGTVGTTTVQAGGVIAPGNSIGTLSVAGNLVLASGSTYEVEIAGNGGSDRIVVSGSATIAGSQVGVTALDPQTSYVSGQRYTILTAAGGVSGSASAVSRSAFLDLAVEQQPNQVDLVIQVKDDPVTPPDPGDPGMPPAPPAVFQSVAETPNQFATALALNTLPQAGGTLSLYNSLLMLDAPSARAAFDQLSGELHASARTALIEESWLLRNAMNDRLRAAFGSVGAQPMATLSYGFSADLAPAAKGPMPALRSERFAVWGQGYGAWGRTDSDGNASKLGRSTGGLLVGADAAVFDTLRFGLLAGYSRSEFDVKGRLSSGESDNYHLGLYGGGQWGALSLRTGASYTWHELSTRRTVAFSGFGDHLRADYNAGTAQVFGELGYRIDLGRVAFEPFAGLAYVNLHTDGFNEIGAAAALSGRSDDRSLGYTTLGLRAATSFAVQGMDLTLRGALAWRHAFGDVNPEATLAFAGSSPFSVAGLPIARDAALVEAGLDLAIGRSTTLGLSYTGQLAQDAQDHAFKGVLAVRF